MAHWCRLFSRLVAAVAIARAGLTVTWNTQRPPQARAVAAPAPTESARVTAVQGTHVLVRLRDGSTRAYEAAPAQARLLQDLIGTVIQFRIR